MKDDLFSRGLDEPLATPSEQLDNLILLVGDSQNSPAESATLDVEATSAWVGTGITYPPSSAGLSWLIERVPGEILEKRGDGHGKINLRLGMQGWDRYILLKRAVIESRNVLMAMKFGDAELDEVVKDCFCPAVERTGFYLKTITQNQPAGLIDDQLRVALRTSRFILADLTHSNNGAYWEAGFAEGLGRPVIYTCRDEEWAQNHCHFDTNHLVTVIWSQKSLDKAADQLVAIIRATLPDEAKMTD